MKKFRFVLATLLASCLHGPPVVAPTATLTPDQGAASPRTRGHFAVVFAGPRGTVENREEPGVTILFNRTMRSLDDDEARTPTLVVHTEAGATVAGTWRWIGTHGLLFLPNKDLAGSTHFEVVVPQGTKSIDGEALASDYKLGFTTQRPHFLASAPAEGTTTLRPDGAMRLDFNQIIEPAEFSKVAHLFVRIGDGGPSKEVAFTASHPNPAQHPSPRRVVLSDDHPEQAILVTPKQALPHDAAVELVVGKGLVGEGPLVMEQSESIHMRTFGPLMLALVQCPRVFDNTLGRCQAHRDITVSMNNDVMPGEFAAHVRLGKLPKAQLPKQTTLAKTTPRPLRAFPLGADPDFDKRYRVTLLAGMTDIYGQRLVKDVAFDVDTEPPFSQTPTPRATEVAKDDTEARPPSNVPARAIPPFIATLGIEGYVLEAATKPHKVPLSLVNVPTFGVMSRKLEAREVKQVMAGMASAPSGFMSGGFRFAWETPDPAANTRLVRSIDLDVLLAPVGRGAAFIALGVPSSASPVHEQVVTITDLAVSAKMSRFGSLVWVTSLSTGKPVGGAEVSVGLIKKDDTRSFVTDDQGIALIPTDAFAPVIVSKPSYGGEYANPDSNWAIVVRKGDDWTYQRVEQSPNFTRAAPSVDLAASKEWQGTIFADRGVYRPGETVKLAAVVRQADARGLTVTEGRDVRVSVTDSHGDKVYDGRGKLDAFGGLAIDAQLPKSTHAGSATATLSIIGARTEFTASLLVADFKPVEFTVSAEADKKEYIRGDHAKFAVHGEYLFHAAMANAAAHVTAVRQVTSFTPKGADAYVTDDEAFTTDYGDKSPRAGEVLEQDRRLDPAGNHEEPVDLVMPGQLHPEMVSFEAEVEDFTRQVVAGGTSILVHPADFYVALKRPTSRFFAVGAALSPDVLALKPDGTHVTGAHAKLELMQRKWNMVVEDKGDGSRRSTVEDVLVMACDIVTSATPSSCALRVPQAGYFIVRATSKDTRGNEVRASFGVYALSDKPDVPTTTLGWGESDARVVRLEADKTTYKTGETAKILVRNPFKEAEALVTVERGGVMASKTMTVRGPMPIVEIPIQDDYFPNVFVAVHLVRGRIQAPPQAGADVAGPDYRDGYVELGVSAESHRLHLDVTANKKEYRPGDEIDADLAVQDATGKPVRAEVTFYAVDEGVLMLTGYKTPDPLSAFTRRRALAVFGMESRDHLAKILALRAGEKLKNTGYEMRGGDKGDDGGGGDESPSGARHDFRNTAYFEAGRITGNDGKAHFHFKLPDNLTSFRLMAVAATTDRFGSGQTSISSSKRLMARPALPRAVRVGDKFEASVVVTGKALGATGVDVKMEVGPTISVTGSSSQHVILPAGGNIEVSFPVVANQVGESSITFTVKGAGESDAVQLKKNVSLPLHLESVAVYGETNSAAAIALGDLSKIRSDQGGLDVRVSSSALVGLESTFDQLREYPYGCTEQLASRMIPLVALDDLARSVGVRVPARTDSAMEDAVDQIVNHQRESGGFGYWDNDPEEPWLSAYAMLALDAASKKSIRVSHDALDRGVEYMHTALGRQRFKPSTGDDDDKKADEDEHEHEGLSVTDRESRAYAQASFLADVLATMGKPDPGYLNQLYDARAHKPLFAHALLLHAMAVASMPRSQTNTLAAEITSRLRVDADSAVVEETSTLYAPLLDSPVRTTALTLRALLAVDPKLPIAARLAKGLLMARKSGAWSSTQENAWALVALDDYRKAQEAQKPDFDVTIFLGKTPIGSSAFRTTSLHDERISLLPSRATQLGGPLTFAMSGAGKLFYSAELRYEVADLPKKPVDRGLFVQKTMRAVKLSDLAQATEWIPRKTSLSAHAGDLVVVDVILESAEPQEQVVIADPLPAGLEAVDFDFATTGRLHATTDRTRTDVDKAPKDALSNVGMPFRETNYHREMKDDRVLTFIPHVLPGLYHFRYLARATVPGTYVVPPTSAECMYSPEIYGRTRAETFEVTR